MISLHPSANGILAQLAPEDLDLLMPDLEPVEVGLRQTIALPHQEISHVYFIQSGMNSVVSSVRNDTPVEIGIVGREGIANLAALMGTTRTPHECLVQAPVHALRMPADRARSAVEASPALNHLVRQCAYLFMMQISSTVLADARATIDQRLARWLLMAHDRLDGDAMPLTHEFISFMLGVRRAGVTVALQKHEDSGWISRRRGEITLLERPALLHHEDGFYGVAEQEAQRLHGGAGPVTPDRNGAPCRAPRLRMQEYCRF